MNIVGSRIEPKESGFTLIEMVIAVAIFAVMMVIAFPGLTHIATIGDRVGKSNRQLSELQFALTYLNRDWMQVSPRKVLDQYGTEEWNIVLDDNKSIRFTHSGWSNPLGHDRSELQRVEYLVEDEKLIRQYWGSLDQIPGEEPISTVLLEGIEQFEIHFINSAEEAIKTWPALQGNTSTPIALRVKLELKQFGEVHRIMEVPEGVL